MMFSVIRRLIYIEARKNYIEAAGVTRVINWLFPTIHGSEMASSAVNAALRQCLSNALVTSTRKATVVLVSKITLFTLCFNMTKFSFVLNCSLCGLTKTGK